MKKFLEKIYVLMIIYFFIVIGVIVWNSRKNYSFLSNEINKIIISYEKKHAMHNVRNVYNVYRCLKNEGFSDEVIKRALLNFIKINNRKDKAHYTFVIEILNSKGGNRFAKILLMPKDNTFKSRYLSINNKDVKGNEFAKNLLKLIKQNEKGFLKYYYYDPEKKDVFLKTTSVIYIKDLKWVIASSVYKINTDKTLRRYLSKIEKNTVKTIVVIFFILLIVGLILYLSYKKIIDDFSREMESEKKVFWYLAMLDKDLSEWNFDSKHLKRIMEILNIEKFFIVNEKRETVFGERPENCGCCKKVDFNKNYYYSEDSKDYCVIIIHENMAAIFVCGKNMKMYNIFILRHIAFQYMTALEKKENQKNLKNEIARQLSLLRDKDLEIIQNAKMAAMGEMLGNITHQWKQPLNAMSNTINNMLLDIELSNMSKNEIKENLHNIQKMIFSLNEIINTFKNFYKPSKNKNEVSLKELFEIVFLIFDDGRIHYTVDIGDCVFETYVNELEQIVLNVLSNAKDQFKIKKIDDPQIKINAYCNENEVVIEIEDNAGGVDDEFLEKIFDKNFSTKDSTGMGLSMSKKILKEHLNGDIYVVNEKEGAKFVIKIRF